MMVELARENQRYSENKVYTRKSFKGPKNKVSALNAAVPATPTAKDDGNKACATATAAITTTADNNNEKSTIENRSADGAKENGYNSSAQVPGQVTVPEDGSLAQPQVNLRLGVVPGDSSSLNCRQDEPLSFNLEQQEGPDSGQHDQALENSAVHPVLENGVTAGLASRSKQEMRELRRKLESELIVVRSLVNRIEDKQGLAGGNSNSSVLVGHGVYNGNGVKRARSEVASGGVPREPIKPSYQLSVQVFDSQCVSDIVEKEKEKRTPKANQFYHNSEFLLANDKFPPAENKKSKLNVKKHDEMGDGLGMGSKYSKSCSLLLEKLMKHKFGWVFNTPVDVEGLGLHDYFTIITHPMDLGTVKSRLKKNWYKSPKEFAEDVRLTFHNAMTYNPQGQDVHVMAEQLSYLFEERWAVIESNYDREMRYGIGYPAPSPMSRKAPPPFRPPPLDMRRILDRSESMAHHPKPMSITPSARTPALRKPKAKDSNKRDMTYEEKQKLSTNLQSLPTEKLDAIVQIIKKGNLALSQNDDEIEVDIDSVQPDTLWELDRFVTNYKKSLSKHKRKAELAMQARALAEQNSHQKSQAPVMVDVPKETRADVRNAPSSLHVQGEIQVDNENKSSSSSSSSSDSGSSSSDSDSDSSSASESDVGS